MAGQLEGFEVRNRRREALRPGNDREISELDLQRHGPPDHFGAPDPVPGVAGNPLELCSEALGVAQILVERALGADGFVRPVRLNLALVDSPADAPVPVAGASELR